MQRNKNEKTVQLTTEKPSSKIEGVNTVKIKRLHFKDGMRFALHPSLSVVNRDKSGKMIDSFLIQSYIDIYQAEATMVLINDKTLNVYENLISIEHIEKDLKFDIDLVYEIID